MKVAVIGLRGLKIRDLELYLPSNTLELVSGGAAGIDSCAKAYAVKHQMPIKEFLPEYARYGKRAPLIRNEQIVEYADLVLAFWDGKSRGTAHVIKMCKEKKKAIRVFMKKGL